MAEAKANKNNDAVGGTCSPATPQSFRGKSIWNVHYRDSQSGCSMPSFELSGDTMPKVGDTIAITCGKQTQMGVVKHVFNGNSVAITAIKKEIPNG